MALIGKNRKINPKQIRFVECYLVSLDAKNSAIQAGYSQKTAEQIGHGLIKNTLVRAEIQKRMDKRAKKAEISADYVLTNLRDIAEACKLDQPAVANKSLELLGKNLKLFTDRLEIRVINSIDDLTDAEQQALIEDLSKRLE